MNIVEMNNEQYHIEQLKKLQEYFDVNNIDLLSSLAISLNYCSNVMRYNFLNLPKEEFEKAIEKTLKCLKDSILLNVKDIK